MGGVGGGVRRGLMFSYATYVQGAEGKLGPNGGEDHVLKLGPFESMDHTFGPLDHWIVGPLDPCTLVLLYSWTFRQLAV